MNAATPAENRKLNEQEIRQGRVVLESFPVQFNLDFVGRCNMRPPCAMCAFTEHAYRRYPALPFREIRRFDDFLRHASSVWACGLGEPLIHPQLVDFVRYIHGMDTSFGITSNGLALTKELAGKHRARFIISQVIFNTVVIGIQLKTAGALSVGELLADGVLSPAVAKLSGMAISADEVRRFQERARREFQQRVEEIVTEAGAGCREALRELEISAPTREALAAVQRGLSPLAEEVDR